ncbi:MAG: tRNA uridine-5-carboxymethylaminomethyl(34) synthesis enzyme MnmG, partial [Alphaproteobacteria bacterium]
LDAARKQSLSFEITPSQARNYDLELNQDGMRRCLLDLLGYTQIGFDQVANIWPEILGWRADVREQIEIEASYRSYIVRQQEDINLLRQEEQIKIPSDINYDLVGSLSNEIREKLKKTRPVTFGAASRIPGVTPAAMGALISYIRRGRAA